MKTLTVIAAMALLLLYVWERVEIVRIGYQVERLKVKKVALERERTILAPEAPEAPEAPGAPKGPGRNGSRGSQPGN